MRNLYKNFDDFEIELLKKQEKFLKKYNSENFILCNYNFFIFKSLKKFLISKTDINIFYLWGNFGIGKTHLIGVLINFYNQKNKKGIYINCFDFINKYYEFSRDNKEFNFLENILNDFHLIVIDDFHLIKEKKKIIKTFSTIIKNAVLKNIKVIIVSSSKNSSFNKENEKILSNHSFLFKLNEPDTEDIKVIITKFIRLHNSNIKFTKNSIYYLVEILGNNINVLITRLVSILFFFENPSSLKIINLKDLKEVLKKINFFDEKKIVFQNYSNNQQLKSICKKLNFDINEICSNSRKKNIVLNRNIVIYLLKKKINLTHEYIAKILGKNHATISHSLKQIEEKLKENDFKKYIETMYENIF